MHRFVKGYAALGVLFLYSVTLGGAYAAPLNPPNRAARPLQLATTFFVTNTNDSGDGSLREAIDDANDNDGVDTINFNISGSGVHTIALTSQLPVITDPVIIDATTQSSCNVPCIELSGENGNISHGFDISAGGTTIKGLVINRFPEGIYLHDNGGNTIAGNFIGTDPTGTEARPNTNGMSIASGGDNIIGGTTGTTPGGACTGDCNLISGNSANGIRVMTKTARNTVIQGNFIGTDVSGTVALANIANGILIADSPDTVVGGDSAQARNVISGNDIGIELGVGGASNAVIRGNYVGTNSAGTDAIANNLGIYIGQDVSNTLLQENVISGNALSGVQIAPQAGNGHKFFGNRIGTTADASGGLGNVLVGIRVNTDQNTIGGTAASERNVIAYNGAAGVQIEKGATRNAFRLNSTFNNGLLGFNLGPGVVLKNDAGDGDGGPNMGQNYPVITKLVRRPAKLVVRAKLNSVANATFAIDYYVSPACDPRKAGEGQTPLGSKSITTDGSGNRAFNKSFPIVAAPGQVVTMTATDSQGNTSEFSYCATVP